MFQIVNKNIQDTNQWVIYFSSEPYQEWFATVAKMWAKSLGKAQWEGLSKTQALRVLGFIQAMALLACSSQRPYSLTIKWTIVPALVTPIMVE